MNDLQKAIKERDDYLKKHPEMLGYQQEIDSILDKTPQHLRAEVLSQLMADRVAALQAAWQEINDITKEIVDAAKSNS